VTPPRPHPGLDALLASSPRLVGPPPAGWGVVAQQVASAHEQLLNVNPVEVTLMRYTKGRRKGGFEPWQEDPPGGIGPVTVRLFQQGRGSSPVAEPVTGSQERDSTWGVLLPPNVPLRSTDGEDGSVRLECFHAVHGRFRLRRLRALEKSGYVLGWQGDLERVAGSAPLQRPPSPGAPLEPDE
jgi:hypothetical protein